MSKAGKQGSRRFTVQTVDEAFLPRYRRAGGPLEQCAIATGALPELLLIAHGKGEPWRGYALVEGIRRADAGGDWIVPHDLYRRD